MASAASLGGFRAGARSRSPLRQLQRINCACSPSSGRRAADCGRKTTRSKSSRRCTPWAHSCYLCRDSVRRSLKKPVSRVAACFELNRRADVPRDRLTRLRRALARVADEIGQRGRLVALDDFRNEPRQAASDMGDLRPMWTRAVQAIRISTPSSDPLVTHGARG